MPTTPDLKSALHGATRRHVLLAGMLAFGGLGARTAAAAGATDDGVIHGAEAIHQEPLISASPLRVYAALTDAKQFDKLTQWSAALQAMAIKRTPAAISPHPGGPFALFGGYITGRFIELIPRELIVQAWRAGSWGPGVYSIARFELSAQGAATKIVFDHSGFPAGQGEHLAEGWHGNYWEPLEKLLAPPRT